MPKVEYINLDDLKRVIEKSGRKPETFVREFAQDLAEEIVAATPVDTGFLRNSWYVSLGSVSGTGTLVASTDQVRSQEEIVASMNFDIFRYQEGEPMFFINGASYAAHVEYGTVVMAPRAYVRSTLAKVPRIANATARRIKAQ